ncbi:U-box domain-containing protein 34-like isoform X2 [Humulus lupulus]|uniref:U-box domain-containing protein 34-like isoform X2 n=1 Tax=Humulus lupulus TaxID=3486 RepID=UPI002B40F296|nr:U-box domain-containing protein 34-like isoform X2 [Humulus lupulus]
MRGFLSRETKPKRRAKKALYSLFVSSFAGLYWVWRRRRRRVLLLLVGRLRFRRWCATEQQWLPIFTQTTPFLRSMPLPWRSRRTTRTAKPLFGGLSIISCLPILSSFSSMLDTKTIVESTSSSSSSESGDSDARNVFVPFRAYCARKAVVLKEVVIDDSDVAKAILDYINKNCITNLVAGASQRNALTRKFKSTDVPSSIVKSAPDFCSVFVISKGKIVTAKTAQRPALNTAAPPRQPSPQGLPPCVPNEYGESDHGARAQYMRAGLKNGGYDKMVPIRERTKSAPSLLLLENMDPQNNGYRSSFGCDSNAEESDSQGGFGIFGSIDITGQNFEFSTAQSPPRVSSSRQSTREIEAEMKRLKLELKQTMDMYSSACKEAISAKNKARELSQWKLEESKKFEEARNSEEAALAAAEMEKAKCKAALEAAEIAQRMAEKEAQRRKQAEMIARREAEEKNRALTALSRNDFRYRKYSIEEIEAATEKFSESMKIGEGGYGPVYKGKLDHTPVAIKVLRPDAAQGRKQFQQEVEVLSCIRHPNMVLLLGACPEFGCLVYEYMNNGSLEDRLFQRGNTPPISWRKRFKIASEVATALLFLHQTKPEPLVHRDLKPGNILLDRNFVTKISDVGLARLVPPSVADQVTQYRMTSAAGTFCYIDPEYQQTGRLTTKSDIYSFGILLLQIITAKPPMGLAHHVSKAIEKGRFADMLDPAITDWPIEETLAFANLALKCAELRKKDRPDLGLVIVPELKRLKDFRRTML